MEMFSIAKEKNIELKNRKASQRLRHCSLVFCADMSLGDAAVLLCSFDSFVL